MEQNPSLLTDTERLSLETARSLPRLKTIQALARYGTVLGLSFDAQQQIATTFEGMSRQKLKRIRNDLAGAARLKEMMPDIAFDEPAPAELPAAPVESDAEPVPVATGFRELIVELQDVITNLPNKSGQALEAQTIPEIDSVIDELPEVEVVEPVAEVELQDSAESLLLEDTTPEDEVPDEVGGETDTTVDILSKGGSDLVRRTLGEDFNTAGMSLLEIANTIFVKAGSPKTYTRNPKVEIDAVDRIKRLLEGASMQDIASQDGSTKAAIVVWFSSRITRAIRQSTEQSLEFEPNASAQQEPQKVESTVVDEQETQPVKSVVVQLPRHERSMDDEPPHVRIAHKYKELFTFDSSELMAFQGLIEPKNMGQITNNKILVAKKIRDEIERTIGLIRVFEELDVRQRIPVGKLLGCALQKGQVEEIDMLQLTEQIKYASDSAERNSRTRFIYDGLDAIAARIDEARTSNNETSRRILQVQINDDGKARLA